MRADRLTRVLACAVGAALLAACQPRAASPSSSLPTSPVFNPTPTPVATSTGDPCATSFARGADGLVRKTFPRPSNKLVPDALYVTYASTAAATASVRTVSGIQATRGLKSARSGVHGFVGLNPGSDAETVAASLRKQAGVTSVSRLHYRALAADSVANDTYLDTKDQWYLYKTNTDPGAWTQTHGSAAVKIAVIDTGLDESNPDLTANLVSREGVHNGVVTTGVGSVQDSNGHGSSTAGLAAAGTNNSYGFASVGYSSGLMDFDVFPATTTAELCPEASTEDITRAIEDAVSGGASVISLSLGAATSDPAEQTAVEDAITAGVTVVAAAGNDYNGSNEGTSPEYPAAYAGVISVGASTVTDSVANTYAAITGEGIASYSNSDPTLVAPGGDVSAYGGTSDTDILHWIEAFNTSTNGDPNFPCTAGPVCRALYNGTSQATPQVAATAALMMAVHGGARSLSPAAVSTLLTETTDVISGVSVTRQGAGRLDVSAAVAAAD
jgi:subtilisin family serine protease